MQLHIAPIVEGYGDVQAVPVLLRRIVEHQHPEIIPNILRPIRQPRDRLVQNKDRCLEKALQLADQKLAAVVGGGDCSSILVLCDADNDCAKDLLTKTREIARTLNLRHVVSIVFAVREFETWFVGSAESLEKYLRLDLPIPKAPETAGSQKRWIEKRFRGSRYSETVDQPKMTASIDIELCRKRCPSFDKLCREIQRTAQRLSEH